ncbi:cadherin-related family member 1-like isoform X2 [Dreissena polymorpha]|uniref:cadherin-related family member 1-like isoform X2 n=1 Tax=Dreissena polymorpha TaxID=45954 RepID=UPI002264277F|nr:cadherin-related family member 1-like isoform X2 [Dreissena polymorpha]
MDKILVNAIYIWGIIQLVYSNSPPQFQTVWAGKVFNVSEGASNGHLITTFSVTDPDGDTMYLSAVNADTQEFFAISPSSGTGSITANLSTAKKLDCDPPRPNLITLRIRVKDRSGDDGNSVDASLILQITDVNDENPQFTSSQFYWKIDENTWPIADFTFRASDNDRTYSYNYQSIQFSLHSSSEDKEYLETFSVTTSIVGTIAVANITLRKPLDFENITYYELRINSTDNFGKGNTVSNDFVIRVQDVQDTVPVFTSALYRTTITEKITQGNTILVVSAVDGDFGVPRQINYTLLPGPCSSLFQIDSAGRISTKKMIAIDDLPEGRICQLTVQAYEVIPGMHSGTDKTSSTTDVWVTILDANGENPANCKNNGNILANYDILLPTMWIATLVGNLLRLLN